MGRHADERRTGLCALGTATCLVLLLVTPPVFAHGAALEKKSGGAAARERGPHGGAVLDIGDGHLELARDGTGALSLYRLDDSLAPIPAEDVDSAIVHALLADGTTANWSMDKIGSAPEQSHFSVTPAAVRGGFLAVVTVAMGDEVHNVRFQVK
ncbi:MAG: hypothetical protein ABI609_14340 [Acidobacteriota bacterium]